MEISQGRERGKEQGQPSLLILDDEEPILSALRSVLRREGYALHTFASAEQALAFLASGRVDIIMSDMRMPDMTGAEFMKRASVLAPLATRIMLSASEDKQVVLETIAGGLARHYILKPWDDASLKALIRNVLFVKKVVEELQLQHILPSVRNLPTAPLFAEKLHNLLSSGESSLGDIAEQISKLPAVVARVLKIANSVHFAARTPIASVRDAIMFIGTEQLSILVFGTESFHSLAKGIDPTHLAMVDGIWDASLQRTLLARKLCVVGGECGDENTLYVSSLLLDIGLVLRICNQPREFDSYLRMVREDGTFPYEAERKIFGVTHDTVGKALLDYWNIPPSIGEIVARHHSLTGGDAVLQAIQVADFLSSPGETSGPHDPSIIPIADEWRGKVQFPAA